MTGATEKGHLPILRASQNRDGRHAILAQLVA
jgi:hypothetical protein